MSSHLNRFHFWWGENFSVQQVGRNAAPAYKVKQGRWHRHDDHPIYITQGAASTEVRDKATTICVSAADRHHNILDVPKCRCGDVLWSVTFSPDARHLAVASSKGSPLNFAKMSKPCRPCLID